VLSQSKVCFRRVQVTSTCTLVLAPASLPACQDLNQAGRWSIMHLRCSSCRGGIFYVSVVVTVRDVPQLLAAAS
jgi:hypothetical protein